MRKAPIFSEYIGENKDLVRFTLHVGRVNSRGSSVGEPEQVDSPRDQASLDAEVERLTR